MRFCREGWRAWGWGVSELFCEGSMVGVIFVVRKVLHEYCKGVGCIYLPIHPSYAI
jgi:hypothetical protein